MPGPGFPRIFFGGRGQWGPSGNPTYTSQSSACSCTDTRVTLSVPQLTACVGRGSKRSQMPEAIKHFLGLDMTAPEDHEDVEVIFEPEAQISEEDGSEE